MDNQKLKVLASRLGKTESETLDELISVGNMVLDRSSALSHISLTEMFQRYIDECCDGGDGIAVEQFAKKLEKKIEDDFSKNVIYNRKHKSMTQQEQLAVLAAYNAVKFFIKELLEESGVEE